MKFRFTLNYPGSQEQPLAIPALSLWSTQTGSGEEWSLGPIPSVDLPIAASEYLYTDYGFEEGLEYTVTLTHTTSYNSGISNPRTVALEILNDSFVAQFTELSTFPPSPGGQESITIAFTANGDCTKIGFRANSGSDVTIVVDEVSGTGSDPTDLPESLEISEPDGWKQAVMRLARDEDFHSLIEFFDGSFIFYGNNGVINGGISFIEFLEITKGVDVTIILMIEIAPDDLTYEPCFTGQLDISNAERLKDNKYRIPVIRDDFWAKFYARWKTPIDLQAGSDLDGTAVEVVEPVDLNLSNQIITYFSEYHWTYSTTYDTDSGLDEDYLILNWETPVREDIKLFSIGKDGVTLETFSILGLFEAPWDGNFQVEIKLKAALLGSEWTGATLTPIRIKKVNTTSFADFFPTFETDGPDSWNSYDLDSTFEMRRGEQLAIALFEDTDWTVFGETQLTWLIVELATTDTAITLSGEQLIDGVMTSSDRVLVKNQGNTNENGVYVSGAGAWTRATDMDTADEFTDVAVYVTSGTNQTDSSWLQTQTVGAVGVDAVLFTPIENSDERTRAFPGYPVENWIKITALTKYPETQSPGFLVHDAAAGIIKGYGLGEPNPFYSELLGSAVTNARQYINDGCAWRYMLLRGLHVRGYTLAEKPFSLSLDQWWKGMDPIFCLGLSYDTIGGNTIESNVIAIQALADWDDAAGPNPGSWQYFIFNLPYTSILGGASEGYTCGTAATVAGESYIITSGINVISDDIVNVSVHVALLDSGFNLISEQEFTYYSDGLKVETFSMSPGSNGTYIAVRIDNQSADSVAVVVSYIESSTADQLLLNSDFENSSVWTNEGAGTSWSIGSDMAEVVLTSGSSKELTQEFTPVEAGDYCFIGYFFPIGIVGDEADITVNFYDEDDNLLDTVTDSHVYGGTDPLIRYEFTTVVAVAKINIVVDLTTLAGSDFTVQFLTTGLILAQDGSIVVPEEQVIRVEEREFFFQEEMSALISNIEDITRKYDTEKLFNKIEIGYNQWQSEDVSGIDDPQTKHTYSTRFQKIGQGIAIHSDFIAASLAIEATRRQTIEKSTDYKFDNNTFIVAINPEDVSPDSYVPELGTAFSSVLNLLNYETRYNIRLSVARNFKRWQKWFNGCLQSYLTSFYKFVDGEGNFDMVTTINESPDCLGEDNEGQPLSEKQNIRVTDEIIITPYYYEMTTPMEWETYKAIRNNRRNAIGISMTDTGHVPLFIELLEYQVMDGNAKIIGWTKEYFPIEVIEGPAAVTDCLPSTECDNPITDELGDILTDENGVCITA